MAMRYRQKSLVWRWFVLCLGCCICFFSARTTAQEIAPTRLPDVPQSGSAQVVQPEDVEEFAPDSRRELLRKFQAVNPEAREYLLKMPMNAYADTSETPGLRLNRMWVGAGGTLLEIEGLPVAGQRASAVMRQETLGIQHAKGTAKLQAFEGVTIVKDKRSGSAIVVKPGEVLMALFDPVDDWLPMSVLHVTPDGQRYVYFEKIDPRFRERYDAEYQAAISPTAAPEQLKDFLVDFAGNDPDGRSREVFIRLIKAMRAQNTFEGYYNAYLLIQDPEDAKKASQLARTVEHRAKLEHMAVATLVDKNRLFDFDFRLSRSETRSDEGSCWMFCHYNFSAKRQLSGQASVKMRSASPIKLAQGSYKVVLEARVNLPRHKLRGSNWLGNYDGPDDIAYTVNIPVVVHPPAYTATLSADLGALEVAFFQRGSAGGYEGSWATANASIEVKIKSVDLVK